MLSSRRSMSVPVRGASTPLAGSVRSATTSSADRSAGRLSSATQRAATSRQFEAPARGLRVRGELNLAVAGAREIHALMRGGAIDGLSIGFRVERARTDRAGLRRLERLDLWEISVVTFPMMPGARIGAAKSEALAGVIRRAARRLFAPA